jgi:hypothetical protein|nr:hypothetical protein [uncultured Dongia sp.]
MNCITCNIFSAWEEGATQYAEQVSQAFSPMLLPFFTAVFTLFWAFRIGTFVMGADVDFLTTAKDLFLGCVAGTLITFPGIWATVIDTFMETSVDLATWLVTLGNAPAGDGLSGLLAALETPLLALIKGTLKMAQGSGDWFSGYFGVLGALVLWIVYGVLWFLLVIDAVWYYTKIVLVGVLGPLLFICIAVPTLRGIAMQSFRLLVQSILEFATLGVMIGLAGFILQLSLTYMPLDASGAVTSSGDEYVATDDYMGALLCGALLIFLRGSFKHVAAQLANAVSDSAPIRQTMSDIKGAVSKMATRAAPMPTPAPKP